MQEMKQSGCYNLFIGLESGCGRTLRSMRKGYTPLEARAFFEKLRRAGLHFGVSMIVGYPGETEEDFRQSLKFIVDHKELIPKVEQVNPFVYYEGIDVRRADMIAPRVAMRRYRFFIDAIKQHRIKHTNAFLGNLLDKDVRV